MPLYAGMKIPAHISSAKRRLGLLHGGNHSSSVVWICARAYRGFSHKCQILTVAWVSRVLTPCIPGEHMDAITQWGRETQQNYEPKQEKEGWGYSGELREGESYIIIWLVYLEEWKSLYFLLLSFFYGFANKGFWLNQVMMVSSPTPVRNDCGHCGLQWPVAN